MAPSPSPDDVRSVYDAAAPAYAEMLPDASHEAPLDLALVAELLRLAADARSRPRVLDAGCGTGRMMAHLESLGDVEAVGVDLSPGMVAEAARWLPGRAVVVGDLRSLPVADASFDGVLSWYSIIHLDARGVEDAVAELGRILRPGGIALVGFQAGSGTRTVRRAYGQEHDLVAVLHDPDAVAATLGRHGLEPVARLVRAPRANERHPQAFLLARRVPAGGVSR